MIDCGSGVTLERGVSLRMRDGVELISDHYYPGDHGPRPTLLMRQPYGRDIASTVVYAHPAWFARQGYNVVIQDVRGRGDSGGAFYPFRHEAQDGFDTIALLRERPECNGTLGMYGFSYQGMTQWLAAAEQPEGLRCIAPAQTAHDLYRGWFYQNGALRLASTLGWGLQMLKADARRLKLHEASAKLEKAWQNLPAQFLETPYGRHPALASEGLPGYVTDWLEHDGPDEYWTAMDLSQTMHRVSVPALHLSGWYDSYLSGSIQGFVAACADAAPEVREQQYLVAGPWQHIPWGDRIGSHSFGATAHLDTDALLLRWFNHWLKGSREFASEPKVRHFALNENEWHSAASLPRGPSGSCLSLYLHSDGRANSSRGDGGLTMEKPTAEEPGDVLSYDPEVPLPGPGGFSNAPGPLSQTMLELGNNVLVYTSSPMGQRTQVFGIPTVEIWASTSAEFADLTAKLVLLKASGETLFLSIGILRSHHVADAANCFSFELDATSVVFGPADRVRLEVASSAYPLFDRNPSTAIPPRLASPWNWQRSTQTVLHSGRFPSLLHLPLADGQG